LSYGPHVELSHSIAIGGTMILLVAAPKGSMVDINQIKFDLNVHGLQMKNYAYIQGQIPALNTLSMADADVYRGCNPHLMLRAGGHLYAIHSLELTRI
jgi:hypothetical protein